jgi:hypothetical protein
MTGNWREVLRRELDAMGEETSLSDEPGAAAYLESVDEEWGTALGISELAVEFLLEAKSAEKKTSDLERRLVETMRAAHRIRECASEARSLLGSSQTFGSALRRMIEATASATTRDPQELQDIETAATPHEMGSDRLARVAREYGVEVLRVFCLAGQALEREYVAQRSRLVAEGLARSERGLSDEEQRKQSVDVATAFLRPKRGQSLAFLQGLVTAAREPD